MTYERTCKYGCNTQLGNFNTKQNKYLETDGTLHTKERCESLKEKQNKITNGHNEISLELVLRKLEKVGVKLDLRTLRYI